MDATAPPARLKGTPTWLISKTAIFSQRLIAEGFAAAGSRRPHYSMLSALEEFGAASQADLGRRCAYDRSDIVAMVNELVELKLVERALDPADRRRNIITITPAGLRHLEELDGVLSDVQDEVLAPLSVGERTQLVRLLTRLVDHHLST